MWIWMRRGVAVASVVAACAGVAGGSVTFSDGEFIENQWPTEFVANNGNFTISRSLATGNDGAARRVEMSTSAGGRVSLMHRFGVTQATRYEPGNDGAIFAVDFTIDVKLLSTTHAGEGPMVYLALKQGSQIYRATTGIEVTADAWTGFQHIGYTASSFVRANAGGGSVNFSPSGAPIRFGFLTEQSGSPSSVFATVVEVDNFRVDVRTVPGPGALAVLGLGGGLASRRRR